MSMAPKRTASASLPRSSSSASTRTASSSGTRTPIKAAWRGSDEASPGKPREEAKSRSPERPRPARGMSTSPTRPASAPGLHTSSHGDVLPPHLSHLYFPSQSFPPFLLAIASKVFHSKMRDLGIAAAASSVDKERRFVWLVCRQSMGSSGTATNSTTSLASAATGTPAANEIGMMSFRVPDASLGPYALREICNFLTHDTRFAHLQLSGNILGDDGAERLAALLARNTNLTSLDVRGTGFGQTAFEVLLGALQVHPTITSLDASSLKSEGRMFMGTKGCKALARVLKHNSVLRKLHLSNSGLVAEGVSTVVRGLQLNRTLVLLDLSCNDMTQKSIAKFGEAFTSLHSLQSLLLNDNLMGTVGLVILCDSLKQMENLKRLDLRRNGIGLRGFTVLTDTIGEMISLQEVLLDGNPLSESNRGGVVAAAAPALSAADEFKSKDYVDSVVKRLHLTDKRVSPRFLLNSALRTLSLNQTSISDRLVEDLCRVLATHRGLQSLHLTGNGITDVGGYALAELIRHSSSLASLHASENSINDDGGAAICVALAAPSSHVNFLSLRVNNVGKNTAAAIINALGVKRSLHVDLSGNKVPWSMFSKLSELSTKNKRVFEASLSDRYQAEWERLQQRHEYRLQVEDQCLDSVTEMAQLEAQLLELESSRVAFKEVESEETKRLQQQQHDWNHQLHETHAIETKADHDLAGSVKELDGRVTALRKAIEKEQRFIASAEKLIPQTLEDIERENAEIEAGLVDVRRDLRLYTSDRNLEVDGLNVLKADLMKFIRDLEAQVKPAKSPKKAARPASRAGGVPATPISSGAPTSRGPARAGKSPPSSTKKAAPGSSSKRSPSVNGTRPPTASPSAAASRPVSAAVKKPVILDGIGDTSAQSTARSTSSKRASTAPLVKGKSPKSPEPTKGSPASLARALMGSS